MRARQVFRWGWDQQCEAHANQNQALQHLQNHLWHPIRHRPCWPSLDSRGSSRGQVSSTWFPLACSDFWRNDTRFYSSSLTFPPLLTLRWKVRRDPTSLWAMVCWGSSFSQACQLEVRSINQDLRALAPFRSLPGCQTWATLGRLASFSTNMVFWQVCLAQYYSLLFSICSSTFQVYL